jgi:hypothetical protein
MDDLLFVRMEVRECFEDLTRVPPEDLLIHRAEVLVRSLQAVGHQLHEDRGLGLVRALHDAVVFYNVWMLDCFEQVAFVSQFGHFVFIGAHDFDRHIWRQLAFNLGRNFTFARFNLRLVHAFIDCPKCALAQQLASNHVSELFLELKFRFAFIPAFCLIAVVVLTVVTEG